MGEPTESPWERDEKGDDGGDDREDDGACRMTGHRVEVFRTNQAMQCLDNHQICYTFYFPFLLKEVPE